MSAKKKGGRITLKVGAVLASATALAACGSAASSSSTGNSGSKSGHAHSSLKAQGLAYYKGKTVTFVAPDKPGGGFDQFARAYAPYLQHYLHATVNVINVPAGNTVAGQNEVATAKPNGLTVGWLNAGPDVEDQVLGLPGLSFNPAKVTALGGTAPDEDGIVVSTSSACSQWTNWGSLVKNSSATNPVSEVIQSTGTTTFVLVLANGVFGVHARTIPGYASSADLVAGFERGDGCVMIDPISVVGPLVKGGQARPLLVNVPLQKSNAYYKYFAHTPTINQAEKTYANVIKTNLQKNGEAALNGVASTSRGFFAAPGVPAAQRTVLADAFKSASMNKGLQQILIKEGSPTGYQDPASYMRDFRSFSTAAQKVGPFLSPIKHA